MSELRTWTDHHGDDLVLEHTPDSDRLGVTARTQVVLSRAQVLDLYHFLGGHLMATGQFPANVVPLHAPPTDGRPTCCTGEDSSTCCPGPDKGDPVDRAPSVALEAHDAVYGDRQADYGHPREDFTRTAIIWTGLLHHKLADGAFIEAEDIARCQIGVKLARDVHAGKRDNRVDMAGYAITLDRLETGK